MSPHEIPSLPTPISFEWQLLNLAFQQVNTLLEKPQSFFYALWTFAPWKCPVNRVCGFVALVQNCKLKAHIQEIAAGTPANGERVQGAEDQDITEDEDGEYVCCGR